MNVKVVLASAAALIAVAFAVGVLVYAVNSTNKRTLSNQEVVVRLERITRALKAQDVALQATRAKNVRDNCEAQNKRHDNTVKVLDHLIAKAPPNRRAAVRANRDSTVAFINALAPYHADCEALVRQQVPLVTLTPTPKPKP